MTGTLLITSLVSVLKIAAIAILGAFLGKRGYLPKTLTGHLSQLTMRVFLPALLFSSTAGRLSIAQLKTAWLLPVSAFCVTGLAFLVALVLVKIFKPTGNWRPVLLTTVTLGNHGYLPIPLLSSIALISPLFSHLEDPAGTAISYLAAYLMVQSFLLWILGFPILSGKPVSELKWQQLVTPPVIAVWLGTLCGLITPIRTTFFEATGHLAFIGDAFHLVGQAAVPCALLILGANMGRLQAKALKMDKMLASSLAGRLFLVPMLVSVLTALGVKMGWLPANPLLLLIILVESAVPPANNLIVMCEWHKHAEQEMSQALFWHYLICPITLTIWLTLFQQALQTL